MRRLLAPVLMLAGASLAQENYSTAWSGHKTLHVNTSTTSPTGTSISANVLKYPMLVRLSAKDSAIFNAAKAGGVDIRFTKANNTTRLKHQIDTWDATGRNAAIWVLLDTVYANSLTQTFRMHWGNSSAMDSSSSAAVFDSANGFTAVWHLGDSTGLQLRANSVPGGNPAVPKALGTTAASGFVPKVGLIGWADSLRSQVANTDTADHFTLGSGYQFAQGQGSLSLWVNMPSQGGDWNNFYALSAGAAVGGGLNNGGLTNNIWMGRQGNTNHFRFGTSYATSTTVAGVEAPNRDITNGLLPLNQWHHFTVTFQDSLGKNRKLYKDGALAGDFPASSTDTTSRILPVTRGLTFLGRSAWGDRNLRGKVDEARISKVARSADWVALDFGSQNPSASLVSDSTAPMISYVQDSVTTTLGFGSITIPAPFLAGIPRPTVSISPALPAGLTLTTGNNASRGMISGTPTAAIAKTKFIITATNFIGGDSVRATDSIWITVNNPSVTEDYATWTGTKTVTFTSPAAGTVNSFPLLVRLTSADADVFTAGRASLRFSKPNGAKLNYSIDTWDSAGKSAAVWVLMDNVAPGANSVRLHWGKSGAISQASPTSVFSTLNGFSAVWHMGNPVGDSLRGARPNSVNPGTNDAVPDYETAPVASMIQNGIIGKADSLRGQGNSAAGDYFWLGAGPAFASSFNNGLTMSVWLKPTAFGSNSSFYQFFTLGNRTGGGTCPPCDGNFAGTNSIWLGRINSSNNIVATEALNGTTSGVRLDGNNQSAAVGQWNHITMTLEGNSTNGQKLYRNGVLLVQKTNSVALQAVERTANFLGRATWNDPTTNGMFDEARVSHTARSADWVALEYATQQAGAAPTTLSYAAVNARPNIALAAVLPTVTGAPAGYTLSGTLPTGVTFNDTTGAFSGTPTQVGTFKVTVTTKAGAWSVSAPVTISVAEADGPYATAWSGHKYMNVNTVGAVSPSTARIVKLPVLVRLGAADSAIFNASQMNGADIRFTKLNNTTRLQHEIDTWDKANKRAAVWVLLDTVYGSSTGSRFRMHFGNANVADSSKASAVFDSANYAAVFHLGGANGTDARPNSVPGGNAATPANFQAGYMASQGVIGWADSLGVDGNGASGSHLSFGPMPVGTVKAGKVSYSAWIKKAPFTGWRHAISIGSGAPNNNFWFGHPGDEENALRVRTAEGTTERDAVNASSFWVNNSWQMVHVTFDGSATKIYGNGAQAASGDIGHTLGDVARTSAYIGRALWNDPKFLGVFDEVRVTKSAIAAERAKFEYENQKPASAVITMTDDMQNVTVGVNASALMMAGPALSFKRFGQGLMFQVRSDVASNVRIAILDMHGRTVWNRTASTVAGMNQIAWNGVSNNGQGIGSGVFAIRMTLLDENGKPAANLVRRVPLTR